VFRVLFNSYYKGVGEQAPRPQRGLVSRPSLETVVRYRADVDGRMAELLARRGSEPEIASLVEIGLHHEQQHQELILTDVKHALSFSPLENAYARRWPMASVGPQPVHWCEQTGGLVELGHDAALDGAFAFDNETPRHTAYTRPFAIASRPATYGDYLAFMEDGGYARPELWLSLGWDWVQAQQRRAPLYWSADGDGGWLQHTLQGTVGIDPNTPICHLSYFEADAFARWSEARLPTELEWELAARASGTPPTHGNFADRGAFHPLPQQAPAGDTPVQLWGDVWEWTQSAYAPYPGFRPAEGAVGEYNGKFMCSQQVLRGGSCATPAGHVRASYRNFFPPEAQWQFSGVRLARDL
jgi:ergothioneine biosynthesis protein EgtB